MPSKCHYRQELINNSPVGPELLQELGPERVLGRLWKGLARRG